MRIKKYYNKKNNKPTCISKTKAIRISATEPLKVLIDFSSLEISYKELIDSFLHDCPYNFDNCIATSLSNMRTWSILEATYSLKLVSCLKDT